jgi:Isochorismatase family
VIIGGTLTNLCCGTTARQAYERGFQVVVGSDVTATNDPAVHEHELMTLRYGFARVLTADQIVQALEGMVDGVGANDRDCLAVRVHRCGRHGPVSKERHGSLELPRQTALVARQS